MIFSFVLKNCFSYLKVSEILENLILEQNDDSISVKSELSAEVATITAGIALRKTENIEELTEIDLSSNNISQPSGVNFEVSSEKVEKLKKEEQSLDSFTLPPTTNFFTTQTIKNDTTPAFCNQQLKSQTQEVVTDPFSFGLQTSTSTAECSKVIKNDEKSDTSKFELPKEQVQLTHQSIWGANEATQVNK